tara:strand:- start:4097 stop:5968 length:1872 start_codon:yes stop_codon:yes gene_type:complete
MPVEFNDTLDEPLVYDRQDAFLRQRSNDRANLLEGMEASTLKNVQPDTSGVCRSRRGYHHVNDVAGSGTVQGAGFFNAANKYEFIVRGGNVYFHDSSGAQSGSAVALATNASTTDPVYWCQISDKIFLSTGASTEPVRQIDNSKTGTDDTSGSPVNGLKYLTANGYRIFGVAGADQIYVSDILPVTSNPHGLFNTSPAYFRVGQDHNPITSLYSWQDFSLLVFKDEETYLCDVNPGAVDGTSAATVSGFSVRQVSNRVGCVSHRSVVQVGNDAFFLARDGVRSVSRVINDGMAATTEPLTLPIQDVIDRINWEYASTACATYRDRKYILAVPLDGDTTPKDFIVFDTATKGWFHWEGNSSAVLNPVEFINSDFSEQKLRFADSSAFVCEFRDFIDKDSAQAYDYQDFTTDSDSWSWVALNSFVYLTPGGSPSVTLEAGDMIKITSFPDDTSIEGNIYRITEVDGSNYWTNIPAPGANTSHIGIIKGYKPEWEIVSKSFAFNEPLNPKVLDHVELEFARDSDVRCDLKVILDDSDPIDLELNFPSGGGESISLPLVLPFTLPQQKLTRKRFGVYNTDETVPAREIQFRLTEAASMDEGEQASSRVLALRSITAAGFIEEFEDVT